MTREVVLADSPVAPSERWLVPYALCLADIANDIDSTTGALGGSWWRSNPRPFDARVQEMSVVLAWFFTVERPWNPYYQDAALGARVELALERYLSLQHGSGAWPEYAADQHSRSATGFALECLSLTQSLLVSGDVFADIRERIAAALELAIVWYFDPNNTQIWWPEYVPIANQPAGAIAGALHALELTPNRELSALVADRLDFLIAHSQSPAGFFHEPTGHDLGYSLSVMVPRLAEILRRTGRDDVRVVAARFANWFALNAVLEPDRGGYFLATASCARTVVPYLSLEPSTVLPRLATAALAADVPLLRAFLPSIESVDAAFTEELERAGHERRVPSPHVVGESRQPMTYPTSQVREVQMDALPYFARSAFTEFRTDPREQQYLYVRRGRYYVASSFGLRASGMVRTGLGLAWHDRLGTVLQGLNSDEQCWSTRLAGADVAADDLFLGGFTADNAALPFLDPHNLPQASPFTLEYSDGGNRHRTQIAFNDHGFTKTVHSTEPCEEMIPLVLRGDDEIRMDDRGMTLATAEGSVTLAWTGATLADADTEIDDSRLPVGRRRGLLRLTQDSDAPVVLEVSFA